MYTAVAKNVPGATSWSRRHSPNTRNHVPGRDMADSRAGLASETGKKKQCFPCSHILNSQHPTQNTSTLVTKMCVGIFPKHQASLQPTRTGRPPALFPCDTFSLQTVSDLQAKVSVPQACPPFLMPVPSTAVPLYPWGMGSRTSKTPKSTRLQSQTDRCRCAGGGGGGGGGGASSQWVNGPGRGSTADSTADRGQMSL